MHQTLVTRDLRLQNSLLQFWHSNEAKLNGDVQLSCFKRKFKNDRKQFRCPLNFLCLKQQIIKKTLFVLTDSLNCRGVPLGLFGLVWSSSESLLATLCHVVAVLCVTVSRLVQLHSSLIDKILTKFESRTPVCQRARFGIDIVY